MRYEYHKDDGNSTHIRDMVRINWDDLNEEQQSFVEEFVKASVCDIVCAE